jgi:DNA-binding transcriptional regulator PaaX
METRTLKLLNLLLYGFDFMSRPSLGHLNFEGWVHRYGFQTELRRLEKQEYVERIGGASSVYRLTKLGRLRALGGLDPSACWDQVWDKNWRIIFFDVSREMNPLRDRLRLKLRKERWGQLQYSVWIHPRPFSSELKQFCKDLDLKAVSVFEGKNLFGLEDSKTVETSWNFEKLIKQYQRYEDVLDSYKWEKESPFGSIDFQDWIRLERSCWKVLLKQDPFLPQCLLPKNYQGKRIWEKRSQIMAQCVNSMV